MLYYSTNNKSPKASFKEATISGQAPDKGLYFPEEIPALPASFIKDLKSYSKEEIAFTVMERYVGDTIPKPELQRIISETVNFDIPLVAVNENIYALELFHGPTLAFKDVGARFMSRCLGYFVKNDHRKVTVLVATSGDTGGAVADGFYDVDGVNVIILYPSGKVSNIQELQLTTHGKNITAVKIDGNFDDCQALVKQAFADDQLKELLFLTSANSINVARWLPQQIYYFYACREWSGEMPPVISVPSGNFGNICAGLLAYFSGLPVKQFIAACNANDTIPQYLKNGVYQPKEAVATISNAMDVGNPSNFNRILEMFHTKSSDLKQHLTSYSISDEETRDVLRRVYRERKYLMDPHGAVAYLSLEKYLLDHNDKGIFLETAHPVKFFDTVESIINGPVPLPLPVKSLLDKKIVATNMKVDYNTFKELLISSF